MGGDVKASAQSIVPESACVTLMAWALLCPGNRFIETREHISSAWRIASGRTYVRLPVADEAGIYSYYGNSVSFGGILALDAVKVDDAYSACSNRMRA